MPERLLKVLISDGCFADMKADNVKYIIFRSAGLKYKNGNSIEKVTELHECRGRGIPDE